MSALRLTKAAILAILKKKRKIGQTFEAAANRKKGTLERAHLKRDHDVRAAQGKTNKPQSQADKKRQQFQSNEIFMSGLEQSTAPGLVQKMVTKNRKQLLSLAKKFRKRGGKLSEYKKKNPVYAEVANLRKVKAAYKSRKNKPQ